jgi:hypothetical protein
VNNPMSKKSFVVKLGGKEIKIKVDSWAGHSAFQSSATYHVISPVQGSWKAGKTLKVIAMGTSLDVKVASKVDRLAPKAVKLLKFRDVTYKSGFPGRQTTRKATILDVGAAQDHEPAILLHAELRDGTVIHHGLVPGAATSIVFSLPR